MQIAITRAVSPRLNECELTFRDREPIDPALAAVQHAAYEKWLEAQGLRVIHAEAAPQNPDGVFVEDAAIVLDEIAIITRPGAASRRTETDSVARLLLRYRAVRHISEPATIDGGDLLRLGHTLYLGRSQRTNDRAFSQLRELVGPLGYTVVPTLLRDCLHLKTAATVIGDRTILFNPDCVDGRVFGDVDAIAVDPSEPFAANVLRVGERLLMTTAHPKTRAILEERGFAVDAIDYSEMEKAEAGVTCCSILFEG